MGVLFLLLNCGSAYGQGIVGEITGTVTDPGGAVVQGAQVVITNMGTNAARRTTTTDSGTYLVTSLPPGPYRIEVMKPGFKSAVVRAELLVKQSRKVDFALPIGQEAETVTVSASTLALDTLEPSQAQVLTSQSISAQPLNGGNYVALTHLSPGVVPITGQVGEGSGVIAQSGGRINTSVSIGGNREQDMTYTYDGVESKGYWLGSVALFPPQDAISEFKVQQGYLSPEFGPPAVVNVIIKSGENSFHGSVFEYFRNDVLDARNYFDTSRPQFKQNQFGVSAGDRFPGTARHHWFGYFEGLRVRKGNTLYGTVPSAQELSGNFTDLVPLQNGGGCPYDPSNASGNCLPTTSSQIIDPLTGQGFSTPNVIPASRINSLAKAVMPFFAPPNRTMDQLGNYRIAPSTNQDDNQVGFRTDHVLSGNDTIHTRFAYSNSTILTPGLFAVSTTTSPMNVRNVSLGWTHVFNQFLVNELRFGYNGTKLIGVQPTGQDNPAKAGFANVTDVSGCVTFPRIGIAQSSGLPTNSGNCFGGIDKDLLFYDNVSWVHGAHNVSFGADVRRVSHFIEDSFLIDGSIGFFGAYSGNGTADFLLGAPSQGLFGVGTVAATNVGWWGSYYINDNYHITPKLTMNLGLRYTNNQVLAPKEHNYGYFDFGTGTLLHPPQGGLPPGVQNRANLDFAPRVGLNYQLTNQTVVRSSYGIYYVDDPADDLSFNFSNPPTYGNVFQFAGSPGSLTYTVNEGLPSDLLFPTSVLSNITPTGTPDGSVGLFTRERERHSPYVQQWSLSVQRTLPWSMLFEVAYVGNQGTHLARRIDENTASPLAGPPCAPNPVPGCDPRTIQERRPYPRWSSIFLAGNISSSNYHALQAKLQKDLSHGLMFLLGYTWGKAISDDDYDAVAARNYSRLLLSHDRARATYDRRQRFVMNLTYAVPFPQSATGITRQLAGGWQLAMINSFTTGAPFGITTSADYAQIGNAVGFARPDQVCSNPNLPTSERTLQRWFDTSCFAPPVNPFPHLGNAGYNIVDAPGITQVDISAQKVFTISERKRVEFRADMFNAINVPNFGEPGNNLDLPNFGTISTALSPREIQFALRVLW